MRRPFKFQLGDGSNQASLLIGNLFANSLLGGSVVIYFFDEILRGKDG